MRQEPSPELRARVLAEVLAHPAKPLAAGRRRRGSLLAAGFALMVPISIGLGGPGLRGRPLGYVVAVVLSWLGIASATSWAGVARGPSMLGRSPGWRWLAVLATPVALMGAAVAIGLVWPQMLNEATGRSQRVLWFVAPPQIVCLVATPLFALGPLAAFGLTRSASVPVAPRLTGAALGATAGAWAALAIALHCARGSVHHVMIGHVVPVVGLTLLGVSVGARLLALRAQTRWTATRYD